MARIKIEDLPEDMNLSPDEMKKVMGGIVVNVQDYFSQNPGGMGDDDPMKIIIEVQDYF